MCCLSSEHPEARAPAFDVLGHERGAKRIFNELHGRKRALEVASLKAANSTFLDTVYGGNAEMNEVSGGRFRVRK